MNSKLDEKNKFNSLVDDRLDLDSDLRRGLRRAILQDQKLQALVYIEKIFEQLTEPVEDDEPEAKKASSRKTTKASSTTKKTTGAKEGTKDDEDS